MNDIQIKQTLYYHQPQTNDIKLKLTQITLNTKTFDRKAGFSLNICFVSEHHAFEAEFAE